jgi:TRAP-type mannitol/chloroaromatic compound transport system substrate-binding protein
MGRDMTAVLFSGIPGGLTDEQYLLWYYEGGGLQLLKSFRKEKMGVASTVLGLGPTEIVHSHKPIRNLDGYSGLKMRTAGVWAELLPKLGAAAVTLPASDVFQALEKKLVDAIEWADPGTNYPLGYHQVAKYIIVPGVHLPTWPWELVVNAKEWEKLPDDLKWVVEAAAKLTTFESLLKFVNNSQKAMREFQKAGNEIIVLQKEVLEAVHKAAADWCESHAAKNPWFKKVYENQKTFKANWEKANYIRMRPDGYGR